MGIIILSKTRKRNIGKIKRGEPRDSSKEEFIKEDILPYLTSAKEKYEQAITEINS